MVLEGNVSVKNVRKIYNELKDELASTDTVTLDFTSVKRVDLSFLQVVIAAGREARKQKKTLRLKGVNNEVRKQMQLAGLKA